MAIICPNPTVGFVPLDIFLASVVKWHEHTPIGQLDLELQHIDKTMQDMNFKNPPHFPVRISLLLLKTKPMLSKKWHKNPYKEITNNIEGNSKQRK